MTIKSLVINAGNCFKKIATPTMKKRERERERERERDKSTLYLISANSNQLVRSSYYPDRFTIDS